MNKWLSILVMALAIPVCVYAQEAEEEIHQFSGVDGVAKKEHISNKSGIPYVHVREADILWSKTVWRMIDLRERINLPMYYPTHSIDGRKSLIDVIVDGIQQGDLVPYGATIGEDEFNIRMDNEQVRSKLGAGIDTIEVQNPETNMMEKQVVISEMKTEEVKKYLLKEVWFFDKKYSRMDVRIIGICPIRDSEPEPGKYRTELMFWIYFPELRPLLAKSEVYNTRNDAQRDSYDDLFAKRRFGSYIFQEANVYNNRAITDYTAGMDQMLEAQRIKEQLFLKEHDMWEF
jgi:gliding motility associated protien GldN